MLVGEKVSPEGILLTQARPGTDRWLRVRREGITATDLPMILGLSRYGNALSVWRDKRGEKASHESEAAFWGHVHESPIAQVWAKRHNTAVARVGVIGNETTPWIRASLDRIVADCPDGDDGECGLEIKTRDAHVAGKWRDDIPDDVLAQVEWGLKATGYQHMHVAVLIGGNRLKCYRVDRDEELDDYLMAQALPVWWHVRHGVPPEVAPDNDGVLIAELNEMFAIREGAIELDRDKAIEQIEEYNTGHKLETLGKAKKTVAKGNLLQMAGGAETGTVDNVPVFTYKKPDVTEEMTADNIRRLKKDRPVLHATLRRLGYITDTDPNPRFNLKG